MDLSILDNEYVSITLGVLLAVYGANAREPLPDFIMKLFKNPIFRVVFLSLLLVYKFENAPSVSLTVAMIFVITMHFINSQEEVEAFEDLEAFRSM